MKKKVFSKSMAWLLSVVMVIGFFIVPSVTVSATQSASNGFSKNYTLTGDGFTDMVNIAMAQNEKTQSEIGYSESWCADFVSDCARLAGQEAAIPFNGVVQSMYNAVINAGGYRVSSPQAGDLVFFTNGSSYGHVGIALDSNRNISGNIWYNGQAPSRVKILYNKNEGYSSWVYVRPNYGGNVKPAPVAPSVTVVPGTSLTPTRIYWNSVEYADCYDLRIWSTGENIWSLTSTSYEIVLPAGQHSLGVCARNDTGYHYCEAISFTVEEGVPQGHVMTEGEAAGQTIPDGDYYIMSEIASDYFLDISGDDFNMPNGTNVGMWTWGSSIPNRNGYDCFHLEYLNNGFYKITQYNTNMCMDVNGGSLNRGTNVQMWNYDGNNAQQWSIERTDHGYQLRPRCNAYYLDVYGGYHEPGTNVRCWEGNDSKAQSFAFIPRELSERPIADGVYVIRPYISNQHFLDVSGIFDEFQSGSNVQLWRSADSDTEEKFEITYIDDGWYSIIERTSGLALEVADPETNFLNASKNVQIGNYIGAKNQLWKIKKNWDGSFFFINKLSGYYLDFESGRLNNGTNVKQYTYNGSNAQRWTFEVETYTISYNMNGGSGSIGNQIKTYGQDLTLSSTKPTRTGYEFVGWNTNASATTAQYQPGGKYTANSGATLYATWKAKQITVTFYRNQNSSDNTTAIQTFTYGASGQSFSNKNWTKDGYTLLGWSFDRNATTNSYSITNGVIDDWIDKYAPNAKLYAVWKINTWTVSYNMNGGSGSISNQTKTYGQDLTLSSTKPTRTDYKFVGWNTNKDATTAQYQSGEKYKENKGATLYAIWTINHNYTTKVVAPTCTEKGYTLHTCTNCGNDYKDTYTNALGHDYKLTSEKAATCTADGQKTYKCSRCGDTKTETVKATGHSYTTKVVSPTCTEKGDTVHTCSKCGDSYKDSYVDALGHDYEETVIAPTETEKGYTLHTCKRCGDSYKDNYTEPVPVHLAGDINGDGKVNMKDATRLHQYINGWKVTVVEEAIDVNGDGKVNMKDVTRLHQYINGWDVKIYVK